MELNNLHQPKEINLNPGPDSGGSKKAFFVIFVFVILFIIGALMYNANRSAKNQAKFAQDTDLSFLYTTTSNDNLNSNINLPGSVSATLPADKTTVVKKTTTSKTIKNPTTSLSATSAYLKALNIYKTSGYYFQFLNCHGTPGSLTMKKGVKFMMDNRDSKVHKFVVMGKTYSLNAYNYTIVTAEKIGKYYITCDGGGAAQITVQP